MVVEELEPLKPLEQRIAERNASAEANLEGKGNLARFNAKAHLAYANTVDRVKTFLDNDNFNAWSGGAMGAVRGFALGVLGVMVAGGLMGLTGPAIGIGILAVSTIGFGLYHANKSYNESLGHEGEREGAKHADDIARSAGAIPPKSVEQNVSHAQEEARKIQPLSLPSETSPALEPARAQMSHVDALSYRLGTQKTLGPAR